MPDSLKDPLVFDTPAAYCFGHRDGLEFILERLRQQFKLFIARALKRRSAENRTLMTRPSLRGTLMSSRCAPAPPYRSRVWPDSAPIWIAVHLT